MIKPAHLDAIRRFEGFVAEARWDYAQHSNGYGTRARHPGEVIDRAEAERRFTAAIGHAMMAVERFAPGLDAGSLAALTSLTFNSGSGWMKAGLGDAVRAGDLDAAREIFRQYVYAGGQRLPGLVARREAEAQWLGSGGNAVGPSGADVPNATGPLQGATETRFAAGTAPRGEQPAAALATAASEEAGGDGSTCTGQAIDDAMLVLALASQRRGAERATVEPQPGGMAFAEALAVALLAIHLGGRAAPQDLAGKDEPDRREPG